MSKPSPANIRLLSLFVLVTVGFALFRNAPFYIWNDGHGAFTAQNWVQEQPLADLLAGAFKSPNRDGYRPLANLFSVLSWRFLYVSDGPSWLHLLLIGAVYGALALSFYCVARRFVNHEATAYFAVLLMLASPPLAATSWVMLVGVQALVPLLVCVALLCYWRFTEDAAARWFYWVGVVVILLFGSWYREFLGMVPILIGYLEWRRARRLTPLLAVAAAGLLHAVFPTALIKWLLYPDLPLQPVFALGSLAHSLQQSSIRWQAPAHFLPLFPPSLLIMSAFGGLGWSWDQIRSCGRTRSATDSAERPCDRRSLGLALFFICWSGCVLVLLASGSTALFLPLILCLGLALLGLQQNLLLTIWFLISFVPILRVFTEHIHFLYAIAPASIILAGTMEGLWQRLTIPGSLGHALRRVLAICLVVASADQAANLYGVYRVNHATYEGIEQVARWLVQNVPAGSAIVSNVIHGEEIKWHAHGHIENYWTVDAGVFDHDRVVDEPALLQALLTRRKGQDVYYLDVDFDYLFWKAPYHRNKYIHQFDVPREDLGVIQHTRSGYFFVDPLRLLVPRDYIPFLGAPDLVNDFYFSRSHHHPFTYRVEANYHLYRALGDSLCPPAQDPLTGPPTNSYDPPRSIQDSSYQGDW